MVKKRFEIVVRISSNVNYAIVVLHLHHGCVGVFLPAVSQKSTASSHNNHSKLAEQEQCQKHIYIHRTVVAGVDCSGGT